MAIVIFTVNLIEIIKLVDSHQCIPHNSLLKVNNQFCSYQQSNYNKVLLYIKVKSKQVIVKMFINQTQMQGWYYPLRGLNYIINLNTRQLNYYLFKKGRNIRIRHIFKNLVNLFYRIYYMFLWPLDHHTLSQFHDSLLKQRLFQHPNHLMIYRPDSKQLCIIGMMDPHLVNKNLMKQEGKQLWVAVIG